MRTQSSSSEADGNKWISPTEQSGKPAGRNRFFVNLPRFWRAQPGPNTSPPGPDGQQVRTGGQPEINVSAPDGQQLLPRREEPPAETLTFEQSLARLRWYEAGRQLIAREERLFGEITGRDGLKRQEEEVDRLAADYKTLEDLVAQTLRKSLSAGEFSVEVLTSAVKAICQEEDQDRLWAHRDQTPPAWRPRSWRKLHDSVLRSLVEESLDSPSVPAAEVGQQSSIKQDLCSMGRQMKADLLWVVDVVKGCYPPEMDICNLYARMYHQAFGARIRKIADFALDDKDCTDLLLWVNDYYPNIFQKAELLDEVDGAALGKLMPEDLSAPLEEQFLTSRQEELKTYNDRVLEQARQAWLNGDEPQREDGCFVGPVAVDMITFINGAVNSVAVVLGNRQKAQTVMCQLKDLLQRFSALQELVMKRSEANSRPTIMANLNCVRHFRDFIDKKSDLFPEDVRESCLSVLAAMKQSAHEYLLKPVHDTLKPQYRCLGTCDWLKKQVFEKLLVSISEQVELLQGLTEPCHQELMFQLQQDVTVEYVRRLLKGNVKLKDNEQQDQAARTVREDGQSLHSLFTTLGCRDVWPTDVLHMIAEVLRLQDTASIQMEVVTLGAAFPDLSEKHISALLKLKTNFSKNDRHTVKATLADSFRETNTVSTRSFFSRVNLEAGRGVFPLARLSRFLL